MSASESPVYEPGDVVYGADPYKGSTAARPWLVCSNHEGRPFHGEQYVALSLTTKSWMDGLIAIEDGDWIDGDTPRESRIVPWAIQSIDRSDVDFWQGRLDQRLVDEAIEAFVEYIRR